VNDNLKILVFGAGVIGSIFAGKLIRAGYDITILARNDRLIELKSKGLILRNAMSGKTEKYNINVIDKLLTDDIYDFIFVVVQYTQIDSALPVLAKNKSRNIVFIVNNPSGFNKYINSVGYDRILIGFPSAGGERRDGIINYFVGTGIAKLFQSTTFGELNGLKSDRLDKLIKIFRKANFSPEICKNMNAWQKTHIAVVTPIGKALNKYECNNYKLARSYKTLKMMVLATRECFQVLRALNIPVTPFRLHFYYLPTFVIVPLFMILMNTRIVEFAMAKHALLAKDEMTVLENVFRDFIMKTNSNTPALQWLGKIHS
jgi:2-dehydropantoate 2-reductase